MSHDGLATRLERGDLPLDVAALEEFTLGRVEMDERHRPARARAAFERAIALGLPRRLEDQARQRLEALAAELH